MVPRYRMQAAFVLSALTLTVDVQPASAQSSRVSEIVTQLGAEQPNGRLNVIVSYRNRPGLFEKTGIALRGGRIERELTSINALAVDLPARAVGSLGQELAVSWISLDAMVSGSSFGFTPAAPEMEAGDSSQGAGGAGVTVAVIDSGVNPHPALGDRLLAALDFTGASDPGDQWGQGTHVAGVIAGDGSASGVSYRGVAPEASIVSLKVLGSDGTGRTSDVIAALEWMTDNKTEYGISVASLALGHPVYDPPSYDPLVRAAELAWDEGITIVCAAGNGGMVESPGNSSKCLTVGAVDDHGTASDLDDSVAIYSASGFMVAGVLKPEVFARGNDVPSLAVAGEAYAVTSGTSVAAAQVAGSVAVLQSAQPDEEDREPDPGSLKVQITANATLLPGLPVGVLNLDLALGGN